MVIGKTWKRKYRSINGERRLVKVKKSRGKYQVRLVGNRNLTDKTARKYGRKRKAGYYSSTDKGKSRRIKK